LTGVVSRSKFVDAESNDVTLHVRVDADLANRGEERHIRGNIEIHCVIIFIGWGGWAWSEKKKKIFSRVLHKTGVWYHTRYWYQVPFNWYNSTGKLKYFRFKI
jgi:hypothetical protein